MDKHIAFITYETPYAPGGGIAAVMAHLPQAVQAVSNVPTYVITPFHFLIEKTLHLESEMDTISRLTVDFNSKQHPVEIKIFHDVVNWIFLKPDILESAPFFAGERHPYDVPSGERNGRSDLLRDALFFGKAAAKVLTEICSECGWTVLLQDWEAATFVLYTNEDPMQKIFPSTYLTLHNSYDSGINQAVLVEAGLDDQQVMADTVLESALNRVKDPIFTVSDQFALDLSSEIFQSEIMIPHIVDQLEPRLNGINNGPFIKRQIPDLEFKAGLDGDLAPLSDWKTRKRSQAMQIINDFSPAEGETVWGDTKKFTNADLPWFVMAGRDDSRQKGYELACLAADKFLAQDGKACFIFFPIPGDEGLEGIQFIQSLTEKYPSRVLCFPFLFREGYFPIMQGATYGMMPSYYEPFGMANEFFLNGLSCLGRATGGIIQQIVPFRDASSFNPSVSSRSDRWHASESDPTGFLFREADDVNRELADWKEINAAKYSPTQPGKDRLSSRGQLKLVKDISNEMSTCIVDAVELYKENRSQYFQFIINGALFIDRNFSWEGSAQQYMEKVNI